MGLGTNGRMMRLIPLNPNPPKDTDGRREDSGRGWVRELQGRWPGVGVDGRPAAGLQSPHRAPKALCGSCDAREGERIRSRGLSRPGWREIAGTLGQLQAGRQAGNGMACSRAKARLNRVSQGRRRGRCKVRRRAERVIRPTRAKTRRLRVLVITVRSPRPIRAVQPGAVGGEARRRHVVQPDAVLEVAYGVLDLGVAAMIGLQFQRLPIAVGDEGVIAVSGEEGELGTGRRLHPPDNEPHRRGVRLGLERGVSRLGDIGGAVHPVGNGSPVLLWYRLDQVPQAGALADGDREADIHFPAGGNDSVGVEPAVGPHRELSPGPAVAHPPHRLTQEVGGATGGVGPALAQPGHQHLAGAGGNGQQRVIAAGAGVAVVARSLLGQSIGLADGRVQVDGQGRVAGSGPSGPGPGQQLAAHAVELTDMPPPEAAQEGPQGGWRLDHAAWNTDRPTSAQRIGVVDAVAACQRGSDRRQHLVPGVRPSRRSAEVKVMVDEFPQAQVPAEGGRQEQAGIGHQAMVVKEDADTGSVSV